MDDKANNKENIKLDKDKNKILFSTSLIFDENIDILWLYFRDLSYEVLNTEFLDNFKYIKGNNTWNIGNICSMYWIGVSQIEMKCISIEVNRMKKKICWKTKSNIGIDYYKTLYLYRITQDNKTLVKVIISRTEKQNSLIDFSQSKDYYLNMHYKILVNQSNYLKNIKKDKFSYSSCIINQNYLKTFDIIINFKKMCQFYPIIAKNIEYKGPISEIGSFIKFYVENLNKTVFFEVTKHEIHKKSKTCFWKLEAIGSYIIDVAKLIENKVIAINDNQCQFSVLHQFNYTTKKEFVENFDNNKKETIKIIKSFIENNKTDNLTDILNKKLSSNNE